MSIDRSELLKTAADLAPLAVSLRRRLHQHPEIGLDLPKTTAAALEALEGLDLQITRSKVTSGFVATLRGGQEGPAILLRADMDALPMPEDTGLEFASREPGKMHACGHDSHTSMLVAAAHLLHRYRRDLKGCVRFLFQPGEEGYFGAKLMLEEGILTSTEAPAAAFALHIDPRLPSGKLACRSGPLMAAADVFAIELKGRGGHASMPHDTVDPIPVACEVVLALQTFVSRRIDAFDPVVLTVSKIDAGSTDNVIPEVASLLGTLRSFSERSRRRASQGLERIASRVAAAHEVEASTTVIPGYPVTVNDAGFVGFVRDVTTALLGEKSYIDMPAPIMGAEDFSYILQAIPGAMAFLGVRPEGVESPAPCHSNRMLLNEDALASGIAVHAAVAARYLGALA